MSTENVKDKMSKIKLIVFDVDGTMTDGKLYYSASGEELKRFSVRDGLGTILLNLAGLETAIITSENSPIVTARAKKLKIKNVILGSRKKINALSELANKLNVNFEQIAFVGDDLNDLEVLKTVGFSACPRNAVKAVREVVDFISVYDGGNGAIREIAEKILLSQNKSVSLPDNW
jgi:YrbI family 3-deoxy-D-manno-octulosonate 8-phosphate phosphatase